MSTTLDDPKFTPESWNALDRFQRKLSDRILNKLEDRMLREHRERITDEDVRICLLDAMRELMEAYQGAGVDREPNRTNPR